MVAVAPDGRYGSSGKSFWFIPGKFGFCPCCLDQPHPSMRERTKLAGLSGEGGGVVLHARRGGGSFLDGERIGIADAGEPSGNRLVALPGSFGRAFRFGKAMDGKVGELRISGSIAYEMAMVARGVLQYALFGAPRLWDVAAGAVLIAEAGGVVLLGSGARRGIPPMPRRLRWRAMGSFLEGWQSGTTTLLELRRWSAPLVAGGPGVARYVADRLERRRRLLRSLGRTFRGRRGG